MNSIRPRKVELIVMAVLAAVAAIVIAIFGVSQATRFLSVSFPLLLTSMLLGARRGGHLDTKKEQIPCARQDQSA